MSKINLVYKIVPVLLIVSILFTACKIPDISKFTEASAQMTTAIRLGVSETDSIIETASQRNDLFGDQTVRIKGQLDDFRQQTAPTLKALKGLDTYLEALNSLATSQKKSSENAEAAVNSVADLAAEFNFLKIPKSAISLGTGLLALAEVLRTEREFRKRVLLADRIVNGGSANGNKLCTLNTIADVEKKTREYLDTLSSGATKTMREAVEKDLISTLAKLDGKITAATAEKTVIEVKLKTASESESLELNRKKDEQEDKISSLIETKKDAEEEVDRKKEGIYSSTFIKLSKDERTILEKTVGSNACGIIDVLKLNVRSFKRIYDSVALNLEQKTHNKTHILIGYHDAIVLNDTRVQRELQDILYYKQQLFERSQIQNIKDLGMPTVDYDDKVKAINSAITNGLNSVYISNRDLQIKINALCKADATCAGEGDNYTMPSHQLIINPLVGARELELLDKNTRYTNDLERIQPAYTEAQADIKMISEEHKKMLKVFDASVDALDTWGRTHANLRDSVTEKKPFSAAGLFSDAQFIFANLKLGQSIK